MPRARRPKYILFHGSAEGIPGGSARNPGTPSRDSRESRHPLPGFPAPPAGIPGTLSRDSQQPLPGFPGIPAAPPGFPATPPGIPGNPGHPSRDSWHPLPGFPQRIHGIRYILVFAREALRGGILPSGTLPRITKVTHF